MMVRSFRSVLAEQCAPTLMGLKAASLFRWQDPKQSLDEIRSCAAELRDMGLSMRVLKVCHRTNAALFYVYSAPELQRFLSNPETQAFLMQAGYKMEGSLPEVLWQLSGRLCLEGAFPHEIGVFLGYPLEDVIGFIENNGRNYTCIGCWKAYGDPRSAQARFDAYHRCTEYCRSVFCPGMPLAYFSAAAQAACA